MGVAHQGVQEILPNIRGEFARIRANTINHTAEKTVKRLGTGNKQTKLILIRLKLVTSTNIKTTNEAKEKVCMTRSQHPMHASIDTRPCCSSTIRLSFEGLWKGLGFRVDRGLLEYHKGFLPSKGFMRLLVRG